MRVAEAWKLGSRASDDGVLVTVARDEHRVRIEVGGGLEGGLTDAQSARIIRETVVPAFRAGALRGGALRRRGADPGRARLAAEERRPGGGQDPPRRPPLLARGGGLR